MRTIHPLLWLVYAVLLLSRYDALADLGVTTLPATGISDTTATLNAEVIPSGLTYGWFEYGTTTNYGLATPAIQILNIGSPNLSANVSDLTAITTYHYRAVATNSSGRTNGNDVSFKSSGPFAVVPRSHEFVGYLAGGVGFSFVPSVNVHVTKVGYHSSGNYNDPNIYFWSSNSIVGGYDFGYDSGPSNAMVFADYSQDLNAGQQYSVEFFDTDPSVSFVLVSGYTNLSVAPQLTNYSSFTVTTAGVFVNFDPSVLYLGANFTFEPVIAALPRPVFTGITIAGTNVTLTWQCVSNRTYQLEYNTDLNSGSWNPLGPMVLTSSNSETSTDTFSTNPQRFYRLKLVQN